MFGASAGMIPRITGFHFFTSDRKKTFFSSSHFADRPDDRKEGWKSTTIGNGTKAQNRRNHSRQESDVEEEKKKGGKFSLTFHDDR